MIFLSLIVTIAAMPEWAGPDDDPEPTVGGAFLVIGICLACYAGHPCLPSFYTQAAEKPRFLSSTAGGFGIAIGYYFLMGAVGAHAFGGRAAQNIIESVGHDLQGHSCVPLRIICFDLAHHLVGKRLCVWLERSSKEY